MMTQPEPMHDPKTGLTNWMDPLNKIIWRKAIKDKQTRVKIRDGREFVLKYEMVYDKIEQKKVEKVWISPAPGKTQYEFAPCGWFTVQKFIKGSGVYEES